MVRQRSEPSSCESKTHELKSDESMDPKEPKAKAAEPNAAETKTSHLKTSVRTWAPQTLVWAEIEAHSQGQINGLGPVVPRRVALATALINNTTWSCWLCQQPRRAADRLCLCLSEPRSRGTCARNASVLLLLWLTAPCAKRARLSFALLNELAGYTGTRIRDAIMLSRRESTVVLLLI